MSVAVDINQAAQETGPSPPPSANKRIPPVNRPVPKKTLESRLWDLLQPIARLWGLITAIVMSGAGAQLMVLDYEVAPGLIVGAVLIFLLETMWVVALFVDLLCRRGEYSMKLRCWDFMRWSCGRARAPFYACVATAILFANLTILATVSGGMLLVLAALRATVPFSPYATHGPHSPRAGSTLLSQHDSNIPDVYFNAAQSADDRCEEMTVLGVKTPERSRSVTPKPRLLDL
ncbi:uncharacterized protein LOC123867785 isoform X2 [Maniola jurtina]|uniref:uncharacterized protein LOC123867785 isoform X1 n=1 Tax=Maniola jurtina TaxID=191418 RepID=UPI001E68C6AA|nr:uncharacterized protein LOC123867785 isoform X1 [Maniola jurtina]XP_045766007.1 uncharacterized protein LOC123867785 isoform X2 [Maniola jurtina]